MLDQCRENKTLHFSRRRFQGGRRLSDMKTFKRNLRIHLGLCHRNSSDLSETCVQQSQSLLEFDYAGVRRAATEVPSNFLETECTPAGEVVFAIGNTGPCPDPLPALCVRYYLHRGLSLDTRNPTAVAAAMNGLIYDCCSANCLLTCFYAQYNRSTGILRYVNAGHDAPILIRSNPNEVLRLEKGGPVFGLQESQAMRKAQCLLKEETG